LTEAQIPYFTSPTFDCGCGVRTKEEEVKYGTNFLFFEYWLASRDTEGAPAASVM